METIRVGHQGHGRGAGSSHWEGEVPMPTTKNHHLRTGGSCSNRTQAVMPPHDWQPTQTSLSLPLVEQGRGGGGQMAVRGHQIQLRKLAGNYGEIAQKLRCRHQTSRSLKEQHLCTGDTQGTNTHATSIRKKQLQKNCGKLIRIAKLRNIARNCGPRPPPPAPPVCGGLLVHPHALYQEAQIYWLIPLVSLPASLPSCPSAHRRPSHAKRMASTRLESTCDPRNAVLCGPGTTLVTVGAQNLPPRAHRAGTARAALP